MRYGRCVPCEAAAMNGLRGGFAGTGLGAIVMEPVRGLGEGESPGAAISSSLATALGGAAAWVMPATAVAGTAAYGAAITALSAPKGSKGKSAATGALLAAGVAGLGTAAALAGTSLMMGQTAQIDPPNFTGPAILYGVVGLAALGYGGFRAYKTFRRR